MRAATAKRTKASGEATLAAPERDDGEVVEEVLLPVEELVLLPDDDVDLAVLLAALEVELETRVALEVEAELVVLPDEVLDPVLLVLDPEDVEEPVEEADDEDKEAEALPAKVNCSL
jgi:hypothetical protein